MVTKPKKTTPILPEWLTYGSFGVFLMLLGALAVVILQPTRHDFVLDRSAVARINLSLIRLDTQSSRFILRSGIPALERTSGEDDPFRLFHINWSEIYWKIAANIRQATPREILTTQFPILSLVQPKILPSLPPVRAIKPTLPKPAVPQEQPLEKLKPTPAPPTEPLILLYHTHTTESYLPESGHSHSNPDKEERGDIVKVGAYLKNILEKNYGIPTLHCDKIHDSYPFRESYLRSQVTLKEYLEKYPSIKMVFDIHRDATPGITATCTINNAATSTVLLVVGTDRMGLAHPKWKANHQFANELTQGMNQYYPGLSSGIIVSDARYNQHLHEKALILEIGDHNSTLEEAYRAADAFGAILAAYWQNHRQDQ